MVKVIVGLLCVFVVAGAQAPSFKDAGTIKCGGRDIDLPYSCPGIADWDGDGKQDLLIGQYYDDVGNEGKIRLYLNSGTATSPVLTSYSFLKAGGVDIALSAY